MDEVLNNLAVLQRIFEGSADVDFPSGSEWANSSCLVGLRVRSEDSNNLVGCIVSRFLSKPKHQVGLHIYVCSWCVSCLLSIVISRVLRRERSTLAVKELTRPAAAEF